MRSTTTPSRKSAPDVPGKMRYASCTGATRKKIAKILINKGANPNHQNKTGQTAGHYANAYQFYDYMSWLFDPEGGNADDTLENMYGLGVYDGLSVELEDG